MWALVCPLFFTQEIWVIKKTKEQNIHMLISGPSFKKPFNRQFNIGIICYYFRYSHYYCLGSNKLYFLCFMITNIFWQFKIRNGSSIFAVHLAELFLSIKNVENESSPFWRALCLKVQFWNIYIFNKKKVKCIRWSFVQKCRNIIFWNLDFSVFYENKTKRLL